MKKIFVEIYLQFNLGDDLFLDTIAKQFPECDFTINYLGSHYDKFLKNYPNVKRRKYNIFNKLGQRLKLTDSITNYNEVAKEHDALLFIGGSIFREEEYHKPLYNDRLKLIMEFKKSNKPVYILGANFGPVKTEGFINDYRNLFQLCTDVCFRDLYSYELFKELKQVRYAPDIIFQVDLTKYKDKTVENHVGFSIIDVRHKHGLSNYYEEYINSTVKSITLLVNKGYKCSLMSFCEKEGDLDIIYTILDKLHPNISRCVTIYSYDGNLKEAINLIASFNLFIAARFHANILSLLLGIKLLPIIYSSKTINMLRDIKFNNCNVKMDNLELQYDESVLSNLDQKVLNIGDIIKNAEKQFTKLKEFTKNETGYRGIV
ncbi:polysaccharide pyruvyl transferase family protein [Heyndrickxia sp. MSNUG]|uniref:polysaccharide pyruvyl transferase family protein n=1 Tax=Heyndrickxia sp. MSNUG TaxID=3136677 RepID=UPI003C306280